MGIQTSRAILVSKLAVDGLHGTGLACIESCGDIVDGVVLYSTTLSAQARADLVRSIARARVEMDAMALMLGEADVQAAVDAYQMEVEADRKVA